MTHNTSEPIYKRERAPYRKNPDDIVIVYDPVKLFTKEIARNPVTGAVPQSPKGYPGKSFLSQPFIIGWRNIYDLSRILVDLSREPQCAVIRGNPFEAAYRLKTPIVRRYVHAEKETNNYEAVLRRWIAIDTDKLLLAKGMRLAHDPRAVAEWIVRQIALFLPGLDGVTVHVQFTSSAGMHLIPGHPDHGKDDAEEISARIWAVLDRPYSNDELGRWCKAANASWFASLPKPEPGKKAPRPLIDTGPIVNAVGLNYTADPLLIGIAPYLAERSFLIHGSKLEASPVIPTVEAIETFERERGITSSLIPHRIGYVAALDLIGDYAFSGKQGFQDPILAVTRAAVEEHGDGVDVDAVLHDIRDRIARFRGARSDEDVARYGSEAFVFAKLDHYAAKQRAREAEAAARLGGEPRIPAPVLTLEEGQAELERVAAKAIADCLAYARVRHAYEQQKAMFGSDPTTRKVIREYLKKQFGLKKWPRAPRIVINATLGLGKSRAVREALAEAINALSDAEREALGGVDWHAPSYELIDETVAAFARTGCLMPHRVIRGRSQPDPEGWLQGLTTPALERFSGEQLKTVCPRWEAAEAIASKGVSITYNLCDGGKQGQKCALRDVCGYFRQTSSPRAHVNFMPHAYLSLGRREDLPPSWLCIIDENPASLPFKVVELDAASIRDWRRLPSALNFSAKEDDKQIVAWAAYGIWEIVFCGMPTGQLPPHIAEQALDILKDKARKPLIAGVEDDEAIIRTMDKANRRDVYAMLQLLEQFLKCQLRGVDFRSTTQVSIDQRSIKLWRYDRLHVPKDRPLIVLDATADGAMISATFGRKVEFHEIKVAENQHVTQLAGVSGTKSSIYGYNAAMPKHLVTPALADMRAQRLQADVDKFVSRAAGRAGLVLTHKETERYIEGMLPANLTAVHSGKVRGLNKYEHCECIAVYGIQLPPLHDLERQRAAMAAALDLPMYPIITAQSYADRWGIEKEDRRNGYFISEFTGEIGIRTRSSTPC